MPASLTKLRPNRCLRACMFAGLAAAAIMPGSAAFASSEQAGASAQSAREANQRAVRVAFHTLDLTNGVQRGLLDRQLSSAVREVCSNRTLSRFSRGHRQYRACKQEAQQSYQLQLRVALNNANARRVAALSERLNTVGMRF